MSITEWTAVALMVVFGSYGALVAKYILQLKTLSGFYVFQLLASAWLVIAIGLNLYIPASSVEFAGSSWYVLVPLSDVAKGSSAMVVVGMWAGVSAARVREMGVGNTWALTHVLERSAPVFFLCFLGALAVALRPEPFTGGDLELVDSARAIAFRYLIATPVSIYAALMVVVTIRFSFSEPGGDPEVRKMLHYFAVTWACCFVWGFLWAGWLVPIGPGSMIATVILLIVGCVFGVLAMRPPRIQSESTAQIHRLTEDLRSYTGTQLTTGGFSSAQLVAPMPGMKDYLNRMSAELPDGYMDKMHSEAVLNALWFLDRPADKEFAKDTHVYRESAATAEFRPSIYGIPEESQIKAEIEEEILNHHRACWLADVLSDPNLCSRLETAAPWVQISAVLAAYGNLLDPDICSQILDRKNPCVQRDIVDCYHRLRRDDRKR